MCEYKMDLIIPICNIGGDGYEYRLSNLRKLISKIPIWVNLILVEQTLSSDTKDSYLNQVHGNFCKIFVTYERFNKPWLFNVGVNESKTTNILLSEMDIDVDINYFQDLYDYICINRKKWLFGWSQILYWDEDHKNVLRISEPKVGSTEGGIVYCDKDFYWDIGGSNEWIQELGGPDNELARRLQYGSKSYPMFQRTIHHNWHPIHEFKEGVFNDSRINNVRIYKYVCKNTESAIKTLRYRRTDMGRANGPLIRLENSKVIGGEL